MRTDAWLQSTALVPWRVIIIATQSPTTTPGYSVNCLATEEVCLSPKCNGPAGLTDRKGLALAHLDVAGAEKWSEGLRMPSSSTQGSKTHRGGSPIDGEDVSSNGDDRPNSYPHTSFSSPCSRPSRRPRSRTERASNEPRVHLPYPQFPMSCLVVKHPEKKLVRRQSSPPGALKENNSLSIGSKFRKTIFRRFTGNHREENNVQSSVAREVNKKDAKKTKRGFHSFSSSPQLNIRLSDTNSSSLQRIPHEEMMMNDVETRSLQDQPTRKTKSIAKEIKAKVQFLRRRHTEGSLQETEENVNPNTKNGPDLEDIRRWAEGFETLLKDEFGLDAFRKFLQTEFSDENIEFWLACEDYKNLKPSKMVARAHKIYEDYVTIQAPREVNLDSRTRLQVVSNLSHPNKHSFEQAQKRIEALMEKDSYPRFLRSDIYIKMQKAAKKNK
ncbi:putative regulator of G-protein signaling 3 isoform X3 [Apostichopus japonicus]|uniref:Putative regulator of G-protein signaling 3 isoform X3 n=1 Tax=Stichopus japonicus TaxID=307972 RepID=A0A2G8LP74_STIJA|nr:putative regulator of G-protein signaling 3 isoform X3 [Apostichopus japonicus]